MRKIYNFRFIIGDLDKVNKNGRVYSKEVIESAFANPVFQSINDGNLLPILYSNGITDTIIGYCSLVNKYPDIEGEGLIILHDSNKALVKNGYLSLQGVCDMVNENGHVEGFEICANCSFDIK